MLEGQFKAFVVLTLNNGSLDFQILGGCLMGRTRLVLYSGREQGYNQCVGRNCC